MTEPTARVLAHSVSAESGVEVATLEVKMHRFVLAEFNTHRVFSRNSASSRAIPFHKMLERVTDDPAVPLVWATEQKGMQGGAPLDDPEDIGDARRYWLEAKNEAVEAAKRLSTLGVHKSICNRLLEPFMWHTVVVTSTEWDNFFKQRCSPLAQPEIRAAAEVMRDALQQSAPTTIRMGEWHTPLIASEDLPMTRARTCMVSAARCARTSYLTHDGRRDVEEDIALYKRLITADPGHWSPLEHVCTPDTSGHTTVGNLRSFTQLRHVVEIGLSLPYSIVREERDQLRELAVELRNP